MKLLAKQQALKAYLSGYAIVYEDKGKLQFHNFIHIYGDYTTSYICKDREVFKHYEFYIDEEKLL